MNYEEAKNYIINRIEHELPSNLHYHGIEHTYDVLNSVEMYGVAENITDEELVLLQTAAVYHDCGFIYQYSGHELIGSKIAEEVLPGYGYNAEQVKKVSNMVYSTNISVEPENLLEQIICDADLDYLGREDFHIKGQKLKIEFYERNIISNEKEWEFLQLKFMKAHKFYTTTALRLRTALKIKHINELEDLFAKY